LRLAAQVDDERLDVQVEWLRAVEIAAIKPKKIFI